MITDEVTTFDADAKAAFSALYPETAGTFDHGLRDHPLLQLGALADLAESLDPAKVEYNRGDIPVGIAPGDVPSNGMSIGDTIRNIDTANSWSVLKNVESNPRYGALLETLLGELADTIVPRTGQLLKPQAYIFVSSPNSMTPYHFDPEHNILLQLVGSKTMRTYPAGDPAFAPDTSHETYHLGGHRNLQWDPAFQEQGTDHLLTPGKAICVPVMAPHFVRNGPAPSISLSITWRSQWSMDEANARAFNGWLRQKGFRPAPPTRFPGRNVAKSNMWRLIRRMR
jgi:hypothetical protein